MNSPIIGSPEIDVALLAASIQRFPVIGDDRLVRPPFVDHQKGFWTCSVT